MRIFLAVTSLTFFALLGYNLSAQKLPSGLQFNNWDDQTLYKKTYHVSQYHPQASDENEGTMERPFLTINKAAELLNPGEKVIVHAGIYHEVIQPYRGGQNATSMIMYEAAIGEEVTISGAININDQWSLSLHKQNEKAYSQNVWEVSLDSLMDMSIPNPFNQPNATSNQMEIMNWATDLDGTPPFTLVKGIIFHNNKRLIQLSAYGDLSRVDGSFWVDTLENFLHINPFGYVDPNDEKIEITVNEQLFKPKQVGLDFIRIKGFTFNKAGNGFMRIGVGAVFSNGGNHWIVEENTIHDINSVAIEIGNKFTEERKITKREAKAISSNKGGMIIRNNTIYNCGTGGIQGHSNFQNNIVDNHIYNIGWQQAENYWECAAVKLLLCEETLVIGNRIHNIQAANAIWLDWNNKNSRVTGNLIYDMLPARGGAIFIEASRMTENWIDHNILYNINDIAISVYDSDKTRTFNNLIAHSRLPYISKLITQGRVVNGKPLTSESNLLHHNIFYKNKELPFRENNSNEAHENLFVDMDFELFNSQGWGNGNIDCALKIEFEENKMSFTTDEVLPDLKSRINVKDFFGINLDTTNVKPGPFQQFLGKEFKIILE